MIDAQNSVRPEPVEGPSFSSASAAKKGRGFDKLSPNGFGDVREQFPGLTPGWHYLDSAATAQKPQAVIDATVAAMGRDYATVHRRVYAPSADTTLPYNAPRRRLAASPGAARGPGGVVG